LDTFIQVYVETVNCC